MSSRLQSTAKTTPFGLILKPLSPSKEKQAWGLSGSPKGWQPGRQGLQSFSRFLNAVSPLGLGRLMMMAPKKYCKILALSTPLACVQTLWRWHWPRQKSRAHQRHQRGNRRQHLPLARLLRRSCWWTRDSAVRVLGDVSERTLGCVRGSSRKEWGRANHALVA